MLVALEAYPRQHLCCGINHPLRGIRGRGLGDRLAKTVVIDWRTGRSITVVIAMNLWFRLLHLLLCSLFRPKLEAVRGLTAAVPGTPNDLDSNLHMTNGRYWNIFDLGRLDLILRMGLGRVALRESGRRSSVPAPSSSAANSSRSSALPWKRAWWAGSARAASWSNARADRARAEDRHVRCWSPASTTAARASSWACRR